MVENRPVEIHFFSSRELLSVRSGIHPSRLLPQIYRREHQFNARRIGALYPFDQNHRTPQMPEKDFRQNGQRRASAMSIGEIIPEEVKTELYSL